MSVVYSSDGDKTKRQNSPGDMLKFSAGKKRQRRDENKKGTGMRRIQPRFFFGGKKKGKCGIAVRHNACINSQ